MRLNLSWDIEYEKGPGNTYFIYWACAHTPHRWLATCQLTEEPLDVPKSLARDRHNMVCEGALRYLRSVAGHVSRRKSRAPKP